MSARYISPTWLATPSARKPSFGNAKVMVATAAITGSKTVPVVVSMPEGASRAKIGLKTSTWCPQMAGYPLRTSMKGTEFR